MNRYFLELEKAISAGEFKPGQALPPTADLARRFGASEDEIKDALSELIYERQLERQRPTPGSQIVVPVHKPWGTLGGSHSITKEAKKRGEEPGVEIINWQLVDSWPSIREHLDLGPEDQVQIMERLRTSNGRPIAIEVSYFPAKYYPGITPASRLSLSWSRSSAWSPTKPMMSWELSVSRNGRLTTSKSRLEHRSLSASE